ncbi:acetyltransferase [Gottschalkia purinilytica]|uniref:Acetyltransferase n=1 Tax=Gottschalkia purinilytica TaxID=1503 RepID=A0A0L0WC78_GOTPU|nr:GNAT family N-acetyltransferase [Gottschalkia purinilytica]KNF09072.1 acetyltransferase [Gottschalkia purinilytica]
MKSINQSFTVKGIDYIIRCARKEDSDLLSRIRYQIDGETENMNREQGEDFLSGEDFKTIITNDLDSTNNLFLVAESDGELLGFSRCEGSNLKRLSHQVEFGICVLKKYWGYAIGYNLMRETIKWADNQNIRKISLSVLETNKKAIELYKSQGFQIEGILKEDKFLSDGKYYDTIVMGRINK